MIFVEEYEYLPLMTEAVGAQIVIHNQTTMPFPDQRAISVTSNSLVNIGVRKVHSYHQYYKEYKHSLGTKPTKWAGLYLFWCCGCLKGVGLEVSRSYSIAVLELKLPFQLPHAGDDFRPSTLNSLKTYTKKKISTLNLCFRKR